MLLLSTAIADGSYKISRPLYFYVKNAHVGKIPGIKQYVKSFVAKKASGEEGYLTEKGLDSSRRRRLIKKWLKTPRV